MNSIPQKGDPWIIARLEEARLCNSNGDNPSFKRGRMFYDFDAGRVRVAEVTVGSATC